MQRESALHQQRRGNEGNVGEVAPQIDDKWPWKLS